MRTTKEESIMLETVSPFDTNVAFLRFFRNKRKTEESARFLCSRVPNVNVASLFQDYKGPRQHYYSDFYVLILSTTFPGVRIQKTVDIV